MKISTDAKKIEALLTRGVDKIVEKEALLKKLTNGKKLRVKLGIDPTSPDVHLGRSIPLLKLRDFQELGHQIVFIVGDFTGIIGDTSDKDSERPMLTKKDVEKNKKTYIKQVGKILDMDKVEFRYNSEWLEKLTYREIGEHADVFSVADFIARENIKRRLDAGKRVSLREMLYPLMQGYDSVAIKADVELGGTDQWFNLLAGRALQPRFKQEPQHILTTTLIEGTDGRKMSSSWGNTITLNATPEDMYGKAMSIGDGQILSYFTMCTRVDLDTVSMYAKELAQGANPRDIKMKLAHELTRMYHGEKGARQGEDHFKNTFQKKVAPDDVLEIEVPFIENMIQHGIVASKTELRRLLEAGGVREAVSGDKMQEIPEEVKNPLVLKIGKRRFVKLLP